MSTSRKLPGPAGTRFGEIEHVTSTGSTNADLLAAAAQGRPEGTVLVTDHQTAGRGRQSRTWHDEPGNSVLMSVLVRPLVATAPLMPIIAGLSVAGAIDTLAADAGVATRGMDLVGLKWPNDVLAVPLGERKLCGILAEATTAAGGDHLAVVIGMGVNVRWSEAPPAEVAARAATLEELLGPVTDRFVVARAILTQLDHWLDQVSVTAGGPTAVLDGYRSRSLTLGRQVRLDTPSGLVEGTASAITPDGALVVDTPTGPVTATAGDAHHVPG